MKDLTITLVQQDIRWENAELNKSHIENMLQKNEPFSTNMIVLPEMFTTGFTMNAVKNAETMNGNTVQWMHSLAKKYNCTLGGSIIIQENNQFYNRFILASQDKILATYDKKHLFRMSDENLNFSPGSDQVIVSLGPWRIKPVICYDLRFPVWIRNRNDYDILLVVANWPASRTQVWRTLLQARAIENQTFVVGVNRTGTDGYGIAYDGSSIFINPKGEIISTNKTTEEFVETATFSLDELTDFRAKFPAWKDADEFTLVKG